MIPPALRVPSATMRFATVQRAKATPEGIRIIWEQDAERPDFRAGGVAWWHLMRMLTEHHTWNRVRSTFREVKYRMEDEE